MIPYKILLDILLCNYIKINIYRISWKRKKQNILCFSQYKVLHALPFFVPFRDFNPLEYMTKLGQRVTMNRGGRREEKERARERGRDRPFRNFISTRLHLRDSFLNVFSFKMLSDPRNRSQERSVEKRLTIFRREVEFHSIPEFSHECIFYRHHIETGYFGYRNKFRETYFYRWILSVTNMHTPTNTLVSSRYRCIFSQ